MIENIFKTYIRSICFLLSLPLISLFSSDGIEYTYLERSNASYLDFITDSQAIHILEIDPNLYEMKPVKALDNGIGRESVLSIATRYNAFASINGGFFSIGGTFDGKACGALKIHDWIALPIKPRGCIGWSANTKPKIDRLLVTIDLYYQSNQTRIDGLNRPRELGEAVLFTNAFHKTTLTNPDGQEIVVVNDVIQSIVKGGSARIPEDGFVLSIQESSPLLDNFSVGERLTFSLNINPLLEQETSDEWKSFDYIVGGTPVLIHNGTKITNFEPEKTIPTFLSKKHARTAVGILPNGHLIFVVVDKTSFFDGMTMDELASFMRSLGCTNALNLDGGGSSTMVFEGSVKNSPRGDEDEAIGKKQ